MLPLIFRSGISSELPVARQVLLFGLWLSGLGVCFPAAAQAPNPGRAEIYAVLGAGKGAQFSVPQVRLADEVVSQRINRAIARTVRQAAEAAVDTAVALPRQLRQVASQACCLSGTRFQVLLNQNYLFSVKLSLEFRGTSSYERQSYLVFDLGTGQRLGLAALVADLPAQLTRRLEGAVNRRIGEYLGDTATSEYDGRAALAEQFGWDFAKRRMRFSIVGNPADVTAPNLDEFALTPHALLLFYRVGLSKSIQADTPDDSYRFPYSRLQVRGHLADIVQKSAPIGR